MTPSKFSAVPNSIINSYDLAGKRKRISPLKRSDSNESGPPTSYKPTGEKASKRRRIKTPSFSGSKIAYSELDSSLDLDHWDKVIDDYLGTDSIFVYNTPTYNIDSDLDQSGRTLASEINTQTITMSPMGNPIRIESSPEKIIENPTTESPKGNKP